MIQPWLVGASFEPPQPWKRPTIGKLPSGPLAGVVFDPVRNELFNAARGGGAHLGARRLAVTDKRDLASALVATGFGYDAAELAK